MTKQIEKFQEAIALAKSAAKNAYAPYSKFRVGAVIVDKQGEFHSGCNVENASYGLTLCAERNAVANAIASGQRDLTGVVIYTPTDDLIPPCGACRQVLSEFLGNEAPVITVNDKGEHQQWSMGELLPHAFTPKTLEENS
jgi:cytidine deaminase